ncbi:MAG: hypothetical protein P0S93_01520 [Candidatus Neptunochlamydia sp.]|nr:hypothetical protein [Candidatus Neptunochlamydia sp.]
MEKLLRKGFSHLASCTEVLLKILRWRAIKSFNGFLNWLISLKEPFEIFNKKKYSASEKWEDRRLKITSPFFKEEILNMFVDQKSLLELGSSGLYTIY